MGWIQRTWPEKAGKAKTKSPVSERPKGVDALKRSFAVYNGDETQQTLRSRTTMPNYLPALA